MSTAAPTRHTDPCLYDDLTLGAATLTSIAYVFYQERLASVTITADGAVNGRHILLAVQAAYGPGVKFFWKEYYAWQGAQMSIFFWPVWRDQQTLLSFSSRALQAKKEADTKACAKKAATKL